MDIKRNIVSKEKFLKFVYFRKWFLYVKKLEVFVVEDLKFKIKFNFLMWF